MPTLITTPFNIGLEILAKAIRQEKERKGIQLGRGEVKLFADGMILHTENPKNSVKKPLKLINKYRNVAIYEINIEKAVVFLYANKKTSEKEIKGIVLITRASKTVKFSEINLSTEMTDLNAESSKTWMRGTEEGGSEGPVLLD